MSSPKLPPGAMAYHAPHGTSKKLLDDLKMLSEIKPGEIIEMRGDLLQPFCSHALYRVRVTANTVICHEVRRVHGVLADFKDSLVKSYAFREQKMFRIVGRREE